MVVVRALDQESLIFKPFERGLSAHDDAGERRMSGLGCPRADQPLPALEFGVLCLWLHRVLRLCDHAAGHKTRHPPGNHRTAPAASIGGSLTRTFRNRPAAETAAIRR